MLKIYYRTPTDRKPVAMSSNPEINLLRVLQHNARCFINQGHLVYWRRDGRGFDAFKDGRHTYSTWICPT